MNEKFHEFLSNLLEYLNQDIKASKNTAEYIMF